MVKLAVLISGGGSNLQALIDASASGAINAEIAVVISNDANAFGLVRAELAGIPTEIISWQSYRAAGQARDAYDSALADELAAYHPDLIVLAGWMHILSERFLERFAGRIINLHPALPGMFSGTRAIERAYTAFQACEIEYSGCMVHYVIAEVDAGRPIVTALVPLFAHDSLEHFAERMHRTEHRIIVLATQIALDALGGAGGRQ